MANQRSFGRRINIQPQPRFATAEVKAITQGTNAALSEAPLERSLPGSAKADFSLLDQDLQDLQPERKRGLKIPWRQLSVMASLCFGVASLVLPEGVNDDVQWLLYALMIVSLYAGFSRRRREAKG